MSESKNKLADNTIEELESKKNVLTAVIGMIFGVMIVYIIFMFYYLVVAKEKLTPLNAVPLLCMFPIVFPAIANRAKVIKIIEQKKRMNPSNEQ